MVLSLSLVFGIGSGGLVLAEAVGPVGDLRDASVYGVLGLVDRSDDVLILAGPRGVGVDLAPVVDADSFEGAQPVKGYETPP